MCEQQQALDDLQFCAELSIESSRLAFAIADEGVDRAKARQHRSLQQEMVAHVADVTTHLPRSTPPHPTESLSGVPQPPRPPMTRHECSAPPVELNPHEIHPICGGHSIMQSEAR